MKQSDQRIAIALGSRTLADISVGLVHVLARKPSTERNYLRDLLSNRIVAVATGADLDTILTGARAIVDVSPPGARRAVQIASSEVLFVLFPFCQKYEFETCCGFGDMGT